MLMAVSLAVTASGLLLAYLLFEVAPVTGKTMNAVLLEAVAGDFSIFGVNVGYPFVVVALLSEGALLFVAAQAGFVDGPRVMANMAVDSWLPHRLSALSERLTMRNGIVLMGCAALGALAYTRGDVSKLVVMYAINVFVAFALSNLAMAVFWVRRRATEPRWARHLPAHVLAFVLSLSILVVTVVQKLTEGAWVTLLVTSLLVAFCFAVKRHYARVARAIRAMDAELPGPDERPGLYPQVSARLHAPDAGQPVAILLVGGYGGLGRHALLTLLRMFPGHFRGVVFAAVSVVDSDAFKGAAEIPALEARTDAALEKYRHFAHALELPCRTVARTGTEVVSEAVELAQSLAWEYPRALVVAGQVVFDEESSFRRLLHNETAFAIQRRLQQSGVPMIVLPVQLHLQDGTVGRESEGATG